MAGIVNKFSEETEGRFYGEPSPEGILGQLDNIEQKAGITLLPATAGSLTR